MANFILNDEELLKSLVN